MSGGVAYARECVPPARHARPPVPAVLVVMDASRSMARPAGDGRSRLEVAKAALRTLIDGMPAGVRVGLRLYGHRVAGAGRAAGCRDTELVTPVAPLDRDALKAAVAAYAAVGSTPIGRALRAAAGDLPRDGSSSIVLLSDGGDNCAPPDPCAVAEQIAASATSTTIQVVGFQVGARARRQLRCVAAAGGGAYRDASDAAQLAVALRAMAARATRTHYPRGRPIAGASTPAGAPQIGTGTYVDRIEPDAERWYAVRLAAGQRLVASAVVATRCLRTKGLADMIGTSLHVDVFDPAGELPIQRSGVANLFFGDEATESDGLLTPRIASDDAHLRRPGRYLLRVALADNGNGALSDALDGEIPVLQLRANVDGAGSRSGDRAAPPVDDAPRAAGRATTLAVAIVGGAIGLVAGLLVAAIRLRRSPA